MRNNYNVKARADKDGSLVCKGCFLYCCAHVSDGKTYFCEDYEGSAYDVKSKTFNVKCRRYKDGIR